MITSLESFYFSLLLYYCFFQGVIDLVHILVQYGFIGKSSGGEYNVDVDYIKKQLDKKVGIL